MIDLAFSKKETSRDMMILFEGGTVVSLRVEIPFSADYEWVDSALALFDNDILFELILTVIFLGGAAISYFMKRR
jgi:hypothetical protein